VDIYVIDQILKGRYRSGESILDAGCGSGRNLKWFYKNNFKISGIDADVERIKEAKKIYPDSSENFFILNLEALPYKENSFDHILCCAVLHFAKNKAHFLNMFTELVRVLKPEGSLLIRVASNIGLHTNEHFIQDDVSKEIGGFF